MSIPVTEQSVINAAKKSKQAALESGIKKYTYFATCAYTQFRAITKCEIQAYYCALCERYAGNTRWKCPLLGDFCDDTTVKSCTHEWSKLAAAYDAGMYTDFQLYASAILVKLLKLAGKLK